MVEYHRYMGINEGILVERDVEHQKWWYGGILIKRMMKYYRDMGINGGILLERVMDYQK